MQDPLIRFSNVSVARGREVLFRNATFDLLAGDRLAVTGVSGCGKSSLLAAILGRARKASPWAAAQKTRLILLEGSIAIAGWPATERGNALAWLNENAGVLFQSEALFEGRTVRYNLSFPILHGRAPGSRQLADDTLLTNLLKSVGLVGEQPSSHEVKTMLSKDAGQLSGGQRKRVALARAMAMRPRLLLLDEPISGLDRETAHAVADTIREVCDRTGTSVLCITHDTSFAERLGCNKIALIDKGNQSVALIKDAPPLNQTPASHAALRDTERSGEAVFSMRHLGFYGAQIAWRFLRLLWDGGKLCVPVALVAGAGIVVQAVAGPQLIQRFLAHGVVAAVFLGMGTIVPALLVIGLCASGLTGELAQKKHSAQLEYLRVIGVSPAFMLGVPFFVGLLLALPLLIWLSEYLMLAGGALALKGFMDQSRISAAKFWYEVWQLADFPMFLRSAIKGMTHGGLIGLSVCWFGFRSGPGESGLRQAISACVVLSSLLVILADLLWSWHWAGTW